MSVVQSSISKMLGRARELFSSKVAQPLQRIYTQADINPDLPGSQTIQQGIQRVTPQIKQLQNPISAGGYVAKTLGSMLGGQGLANAVSFGQQYTPTIKSAPLRALSSAGTQLLSNQQAGVNTYLQGAKERNLPKTWSGALRVAAPAIALSGGVPTAAFSAGVGGGLSGISAKLTGKDIAQSVGSGAIEGLNTRAITRFTNPIIEKGLGNIATSKLGQDMGKLGVQTAQRLAGGFGNVIEDEIINTFNQVKSTNPEKFVSFVAGAVLSGNDELSRALQKKLAPFIDQTGNVSRSRLGQAKQVIEKTMDDFKGSNAYRLTYNDENGISKSLTINKADASDWTAYLQSKGIDYKMNLTGGSVGAVGQLPKPPKIDDSLLQEARKYSTGNNEYYIVHNTEKAPKAGAGDQFGQNIEPAGKYVNLLSPDRAEQQAKYFRDNNIKNMVVEKVQFKNPLVIDAFNLTSKEWKTKLSKEFGGLTGKDLSKELANKGYDGIITMDNGHPSESIHFDKLLNKSTDATQSLLDEARKYKSAEEFIKAQGEPLYHGTNAKFSEFNLKNSGQTDGGGFLGKATYLSSDADNAQSYGKNLMEARVKLDNPLVITDSYSFGAVDERIIRKTLGLSENASVDQVTKTLKNKGYDGVIVNTPYGEKAVEVAVLDPSKVKTTSQLTDIYNQANKTTTNIFGQTIPVPPKGQAGFVDFNATVGKPIDQLSELETQVPKKKVQPSEIVELPQVEKVKVASSEPIVAQRKFLQTVAEAGTTTKTAKARVKQLGQEYVTESNYGQIKEADRIIKSSPDKARELVFSQEPTSVNKTVLGIRLAKQYENAKNYDAAIDVVEELDRQLREQGRGIQAASLWNKLSPEAIIRSANRVASKYGTMLDDATKKVVYKRMSEIQKLPEGVDKNKQTLEVLNMISDRIPLTPGELFDAYRYTNLLSSPKTHERNIYQNLFTTLVARPLDMVMGGIYDLVRHPYNPMARDISLSDAPNYYKSVFTNWNNALGAAKEAMKTQDITLDMRGDNAIEALRQQKVPGVLSAVPKFMQAQDKFFSTLIAGGEKARLMSHGLGED